MKFYRKKYILMGDYIETYYYRDPIYRAYKKKFTKLPKPVKELTSSQPSFFDPVKKIDPTSPDHKKMTVKIVKRVFSLTRTRREIRRIVNSNPDFTKFVTLTFAKNVTNLDIANREFKTFIQRLSYFKRGIKYLAVVEFQERGAVHYHLIINKYIATKKLETFWGQGFVKINKIKHLENVGSYVSKYLQKDVSDIRLFGRKVYFCSKNIVRPVVVTDVNVCNKLELMYNLNVRESIKNFTYSNEYVGTVDYSLFKI